MAYAIRYDGDSDDLPSGTSGASGPSMKSTEQTGDLLMHGRHGNCGLSHEIIHLRHGESLSLL